MHVHYCPQAVVEDSLTKVELHEAAAIVQEALGNAPRQAHALYGQRAEGTPRELAQTSARYGQRRCQRARKPAVTVQVQMTQALRVRQR